MIVEQGDESVIEEECLDDVASASAMLLRTETSSMSMHCHLVVRMRHLSPQAVNMRKKTFPDSLPGSTVCVMEDHGSHDSMVRNNREQTDNDISTGDRGVQKLKFFEFELALCIFPLE